MSNQQLAKVWAVLGLALTYYAGNSWLATQGAHEIFSGKLVSNDRAPAAVFAIVICSTLSICVSLVGTLHANRAEGPWHTRIPTFAFERIDTGSSEGKIFQLSFLLLFSAVPLLAMAHFWQIVAASPVITTASPVRELSGIWDWSGLESISDPARICSEIQRAAVLSCQGSATFFPFIEPLILTFLIWTSIALVVRHWIRLMRRQQAMDDSTVQTG